MSTALATYQELLNAAVEEAETQLAPPQGSDIESIMRHRGEVMTHASRTLAASVNDLSKAMVRIMFEVESNKLYRYMDQEYVGLRDWARHAFLNEDGEDSYSWDYIRRLAAFVEIALVDMESRVIISEHGEVLVDVNTIIENARPTAMSQMTYYYNQADEDTKNEIMVAIADGKSGHDLVDLKEKVQKQIYARENDGAEMPDREKTPIKIVAQQDVNGNYRLSGTISEREFHLVQSILGQAVEFAFA